MKNVFRMSVLITVLTFGLVFSLPVFPQESDASSDQQGILDGITVSEMYTHENLTVVFLNSSDHKKSEKKIMTLSEAEEQGTLEITEKKNADVQELLVSNTSDDHWILLQAGDVMEGGKQDRTIARTTMIPPNTKQDKIRSFCVEQSRWQTKSSKRLESADYQANASTRQAAISQESQHKVWDEVRKERDALDVKKGESSAADVRKDQKAMQTYKPYVEKLRDHIDAQNHPIGAVFAIDGTVIGAEMYRFPSLFRTKWSQLLSSYARSAVVQKNESTGDAEKKKLTDDAFTSFVRRITNGDEQTEKLSKNVSLHEYKGEQNVTQELNQNGKWIQRTSFQKASENDNNRTQQSPEQQHGGNDSHQVPQESSEQQNQQLNPEENW